jgi:hypothetical protein
MRALLGWGIIALVFCSAGALLAFPVHRLTRRLGVQAPQARWVFVTLTLSCSVALWYLVPLAVHKIFGRMLP